MNVRRAIYRSTALIVVIMAGLTTSGCGPVKVVARPNIPPPLIVKIPVAVALYVPPEFASYVHKEERWSTDWNVELGASQTEGLTRLLNAMFERVVQVDSVSAGAQAGSDIRAVLEPAIEEFAFVTPRDAGSPFFAVSVKYRMNVYSPDGRLAESWGFTGYGTAPSQGISTVEPLAQATALALRDAGAKLAVEFREQAIVRGLLPENALPDTPVPAAPASASEPPVEPGPADSSPSAAAGGTAQKPATPISESSAPPP